MLSFTRSVTRTATALAAGLLIGAERGWRAREADDTHLVAGIRTFGPTRAAAQLEGSKGFTKELCAEFGIPTAASLAIWLTALLPIPSARAMAMPLLASCASVGMQAP